MTDLAEAAAGAPVAAPPQRPEPASATRPPPPASAAPARRLRFLDAVRGIAALVVALHHFTEEVSDGYLRWSHEVFRPGESAVVLFFLTSGFIIPVSVERYRAVGRFWIGRFFRLYPLYWAVTGAALLLFLVDRFPLADTYQLHWVRATAANVTMAQEFLGQPHVLGQAWTLSYELVFYGIVSLLFLTRVHRRPGVVLGIGLVAAAVVGTALPARLLTDGTPTEQAWVAAACLGAAALAGGGAWLARRSAGAAAGAALFAAVVVALLANRNHHAWFSLLVLSSMFVGWVLHRSVTGRAPARRGVLAVAAATAGVLAVHQWHFSVDYVPGTDIHTSMWAEILTFLAAYAAFAAALALRRRSFPAALRWLGEVSYSVYLVHGVVLAAVPAAGGPAGPVLTVALWLAVTLVASWLTYRLIERPFHEMGRSLAGRLASTAR